MDTSKKYYEDKMRLYNKYKRARTVTLINPLTDFCFKFLFGQEAHNNDHMEDRDSIILAYRWEGKSIR